MGAYNKEKEVRVKRKTFHEIWYVQEWSANMIIIDETSVYEIDEECIRKRKVPLECKLPIQREKKEAKNREKNRIPQTPEHKKRWKKAANQAAFLDGYD